MELHQSLGTQRLLTTRDQGATYLPLEYTEGSRGEVQLIRAAPAVCSSRELDVVESKK